MVLPPLDREKPQALTSRLPPGRAAAPPFALGRQCRGKPGILSGGKWLWQIAADARRRWGAPRGKPCLRHAPITPTVDVIVHVPGQGVVLVQRRNPPLGWALPGGFVDCGETVEAAAMREAREETGLDVELTGLFGVYSDRSFCIPPSCVVPDVRILPLLVLLPVS